VAVSEFQKVLSSNPSDYVCLLMTGMCHLELHRLTEAQAVLTKAAALSDSNALANFSLGNVHRARRQPLEAVRSVPLSFASASFSASD
jgi:hypothetical protein